MHVVFDPRADCPSILDITNANVNDAQIGRTIAIEPGATYVFDKAIAITAGGPRSLRRARSLSPTQDQHAPRHPRRAPIALAHGDGFTVLEDSEVRLASKGDSQLPIRLRRLVVQRTHGKTIPC